MLSQDAVRRLALVDLREADPEQVEALLHAAWSMRAPRDRSKGR